MLYAIARELEVALQTQRVPFPVFFGPDVDSVATTERIVIDYSGPGADQIGPPRSEHKNPRMPLVRTQGGTLRIYAQSTLDGAMWHDHAERAEQVLDHVLAELEYLVKARKNVITFGAGGFVQPEDADGTEVPGGAVYELAFSVDRGVFRRTWEGDARPSATVGGVGGITITSTTKASKALGAAGDPPLDAETAC